MSVAEMRHADDESLVTCYLCSNGLAEASPGDHVTWAHVVSCPACEERYRLIVAELAAMKDDLQTDADIFFTDARLEHQRERILRRVQSSDAHARVLPFPVQLETTIHPHWPRFANRWIAAAATAGVLVGLAAGRMIELRSEPPDAATSRDVATLTGAAVRVVPRERTYVTDPAAEERFLFEVEEAISSQHVKELQPFDALTPRVRDISVDLK